MHNQPHTWPRLFVEANLSTGAQIPLPFDQSHYLLHVLRAGQGDSIRIFNGRGGEWRAVIETIPASKKQGLVLKLLEQRLPQIEEPDITLYGAIIKRVPFDFMIMKATELGVRAIQPILTARTQIRDANVERLRAIAVEAAEQSERMSVPHIFPPVSLTQALQAWPASCLGILCAEFGEAQPVAQAFAGQLAQSRPKAGILTGPEGGFTNEEMTQIRETIPEILPIRLGPRILRADTAAIAALSCWQAQCGDWPLMEKTKDGQR